MKNFKFILRMFFYVLSIKILCRLQGRSDVLRFTSPRDYEIYLANKLSPNQVINEEAGFFKKK